MFSSKNLNAISIEGLYGFINIFVRIKLIDRIIILFFKTHIVAISLFLTTFVTGFVASNLNWGGNQWVDILESDAKGYYAYLPAVFIYHDLNFGFYDEIELNKYYQKQLVYDYRSSHEGHIINKYYCGTALAEMPFFLAAHILAKPLGYPPDGYSKIYLVTINMAAMVYMLIGFIFLIKLLRLYKIKESIIAFIIPVLAFGTNIFVYTVCDPGMSHIYSLFFFSAFIYWFKSFSINYQRKYLLLSALALGIITLIRPTNALLVFGIPFICGSKENFISTFRFLFSKLSLLFSGLIIFFLIVGIQPLIYYLSCGSPFVYAYGDERFYFGHPHIFDILFSYRKGLFLYTPILLFAAWGMVRLWRSDRFSGLSLVLFLGLITYIFSSWHCWWYGASFSSRVYLEFLPFFAIPLCLFLQSIQKTMTKRIVFSVIVLLTLICQIQIYQYRYYKIDSQYETREQYWKEFLRIDRLI